MWAWKERDGSNFTPKLGMTDVSGMMWPSMAGRMLQELVICWGVLISIAYVLLLLSWRKLFCIRDLTPSRQLDNVDKADDVSGFV